MQDMKRKGGPTGYAVFPPKASWRFFWMIGFRWCSWCLPLPHSRLQWQKMDSYCSWKNIKPIYQLHSIGCTVVYTWDWSYVVYSWHWIYCCIYLTLLSFTLCRQFQFVVPCAQQGTTNLVHHWMFSVLSRFADQIGSIDSWHTGTKKSLLQGPVLAKKTSVETLEILTVVYSHWTCTTSFFWSQSGINTFLKSSKRKSIYLVLCW